MRKALSRWHISTGTFPHTHPSRSSTKKKNNNLQNPNASNPCLSIYLTTHSAYYRPAATARRAPSQHQLQQPANWTWASAEWHGCPRPCAPTPVCANSFWVTTNWTPSTAISNSCSGMHPYTCGPYMHNYTSGAREGASLYNFARVSPDFRDTRARLHRLNFDLPQQRLGYYSQGRTVLYQLCRRGWNSTGCYVYAREEQQQRTN